MVETNILSERYRKYLIKVKHEHVFYFTVSGADLEDKETDKLLINSSKDLLLFEKKETLINYILLDEYLFDKLRFQNWAKLISPATHEYNVYDLDMLIETPIDFSDMYVLKNMIDCIALIEDYAFQVQQKGLLRYILSKAIRQFKDYYMDKFVWKNANSFEMDLDNEQLLKSLRKLHAEFKPCLLLRK